MTEPCPTCADCPTCRGRRVLPPIKICGSETCGREFRWHDGRSEDGQYRTEGVKYCSHPCAKAQGQRELRRRRKTERTAAA